MPAQERRPAPTDERIKLLPVPAKRMIVIRFSGTADDGLVATKTAELRKYAADHKLSVTGELSDVSACETDLAA